MDSAAIMQAISTVGFPIAMCLVLAWYVNSTEKAHREQITAMAQMHKEEASKMTEALNNNTLTIQRLVDILSGKDTKNE